MEDRYERTEIEAMKLFSFYFKNDKFTRLITVFRHLPFYRSSGKNSHQPNTWFTFNGIDEKTEWLIKPPRIAYLSKKILAKWKEIDGESEVKLFRFGSMPTLCMSASIGGGFWATEKGMLFKEFLDNEVKEASSYYLSADAVSRLHEMVSNNEISKKITAPSILNIELMKLNVYVPAGNRYAKTPRARELKWFTHSDADVQITNALTSMLVRNTNLNQEKFLNLLKLSYTAAFDYAYKWFFFEDRVTWSTLLSYIKKYGNALSVDHLKEINCFKNISDEQYVLLCNPVKRKAIRTLIDSDLLNDESILLVEALYKNKILHKYISLLQHHQCVNELLILQKSKTLTKTNIDLIELPSNKNLKKDNSSSPDDITGNPVSPSDAKLLLLNGIFQQNPTKPNTLQPDENVKKLNIKSI